MPWDVLGAVDGAGCSGASVGAGAPVPEPPNMKPDFEPGPRRANVMRLDTPALMGRDEKKALGARQAKARSTHAASATGFFIRTNQKASFYRISLRACACGLQCVLHDTCL